MKQSVYNLRLVNFCLRIRSLQNHRPSIEEGAIGFREGTDNLYLWLYYDSTIFHQLPIIFPEDWFHVEYFSEMFGPLLKDYPLEVINILDAVAIWFGLTNDEMAHCFDLGINRKAGMQDCEKYGGMQLYYNSTPSDIAYNIDKMVQKRIMKL